MSTVQRMLSVFRGGKGGKGGIEQIENVIGEFDSMRTRLQLGIDRVNAETAMSQQEILALNEKIRVEEAKQEALSTAATRAQTIISNIKVFLAE
jgi:hypothetical protein